ncbi:MAG: protein O-mannosyl-transferase family, partial [Bacteroidota bacterium]
FFSSLTFWVFLKWYIQKENQPQWFFLGVYLLGLSIGVHLLNLLLVPVFVLLYGWRRYGHRLAVTLPALVGGILLLGLLFWGLVMNGLWPAEKLELWMVNSLGLPRHSGLFAWVLVLVGIHIGVLAFFKQKYRRLRFAILISALIFMGWFSYTLVPVRAAANPPVNMNAPDDVFSLNDYINRKQYGDRPLLYGTHAWADPVDWEETYGFYFNPKKQAYERFVSGSSPVFEQEERVWFPRMYSNRSPHPLGYERWTDFDPAAGKPTLSNQFDFLLRYQMGHQYLRYLLWNFAGRQNDEQGHGDMMSGNWATGIDYLDRIFLGSREHPTAIDRYTPAANYYFAIPLLLVLTGLFYLLRHGPGRRRILLILALFVLMTGPAVVLYLNQPPFEPRERDYVYLASFMGVAMFAGMGIFALLKKVFYYGESLLTGILSSVLLFMAGPGLLFSVNLNDHDRSDRYLARDLAVSQLRSCPPGAILFTYGDNDTYPLWYARQVENIRPDVRIVNLGLLNTPWYIDQVQQAVPGTRGLQMTLETGFYRAHRNDFFEVSKISSSSMPGAEVLARLPEDHQEEQKGGGGIFGTTLHPVWELPLPNGEEKKWEITDRYLNSGDLALFDIISTNGQERPVCFTRNVKTEELKGLDNHLVSHGLVLKFEESLQEREKKEHLLAEHQIFRDSLSIGREKKSWWDHSCRQALTLAGYRNASLTLARRLQGAGKKQEAASVLTTSLASWPYSPHADQDAMIDMARLLMQSGKKEKASGLVRNIAYANLQNVYFFVYSGFDATGVRNEYCERFREIRELAAELQLQDVLLETEVELQTLCEF